MASLGRQTQDTRIEWPEVKLETHVHDFALSALMQMVTKCGLPGDYDTPRGLDDSWWIQQITSKYLQGSEHNDCFVIPYALYDKSAFDKAAEQDAIELKHEAFRARCDLEDIKGQIGALDENEKKQKQKEDVARLQAYVENVQFQAKKAEAKRQQEKDNMTRTVRAHVKFYRDGNTVSRHFPDEIQFQKSKCDTEAGEDAGTIRNLDDTKWWEFFSKCKVSVAPYPRPSDTSKLGYLNRANGIRHESAKSYCARLDLWMVAHTADPNRLDILPWKPERHEAGYDVYVLVSDLNKQVGPNKQLRLIGDRSVLDTETPQKYMERCQKWAAQFRNDGNSYGRHEEACRKLSSNLRREDSRSRDRSRSPQPVDASTESTIAAV